MRTLRLLSAAALLICGAPVFGQSPSSQTTQAPAVTPQTQTTKHHGKSTVGEYGSGTGDAAKGAAGGAGRTAEGAGDVVTLHPVKGAENVGKGAGDVGKGAAKGTGKVVKGTGKIITHPF